MPQNVLWVLALCVMALIVCVLLGKLYFMRKAAREIRTGFAQKLNTDTNTQIDLSSRSRCMRALANDINMQLRVLRRQRLQYLQGDRELKEAITNISHDLRTPLTAICGYLDLLKDMQTSEEVTRYLAQITERVNALRQLTEELLHYSIVTSVQPDKAETLDLCGLLEESLLSFFGVMRQKNITPTIDLPTQRVMRTLPRAAVQRIFGNIISNALKYSDGDFTVSLNEEGTAVFSNTAKHIDTVQVAKLFDRFYTVESGTTATGLGLSIAKHLTEQLGGTITAHLENDRLSFVVCFPKTFPDSQNFLKSDQ